MTIRKIFEVEQCPEDGWAIFTMDCSDPSPCSPEPLRELISELEAKDLIKQLENVFPRLRRYAAGFAAGKAAVQFPVCACEFADDEETLISPCQAHQAWAESQRFKADQVREELASQHPSTTELLRVADDLNRLRARIEATIWPNSGMASARYGEE